MAELLTALQDQLDATSRRFYECAGVLQRDAPPAPTAGGEALVAPPGPVPGFDVAASASAMAAGIAEEVRRTEALLRRLPDEPLRSAREGGGDKAAAAAAAAAQRFAADVAALQRQHADAAAELTAAVDEAEATLAQLQALHAALARAKLRAAAVPAGGGAVDALR